MTSTSEMEAQSCRALYGRLTANLGPKAEIIAALARR